MAKMIASLADGRVVPWFSADPVPASFVEIPAPLLAKFAAGEITDGVALAKAALAGDVGEPDKLPPKTAKSPAGPETKNAKQDAGDDNPFGGSAFA